MPARSQALLCFLEPRQDVNWPPQSARDALAASPNGRKRLEKYYQSRRPTSPFSPGQPSRGRTSSPSADEEDEETLQLQLKAIEARLKLKKLRKDKAKSSVPVDAVEVPSSPKRRLVAQAAPESPRRIQLGIDKGVKANDVSLKRARSLREPVNSRTQGQAASNRPVTKAKSFGERLAESRDTDKERATKQQRSQDSKSKGFGLPRQPMLASRDHAIAETLPSKSKKDASDPCEYSKFSLSKRHLEPSILDEALSNKVIYSIPKLLKEVTSPDYDPPDLEDDYIVTGIIASKSTPRTHAPTHQTSTAGDPDTTTRPKFMVLHLTDLTWTLDLFLFGTGFSTFYKLTVGTAIAILNPGIMPPKPHMKDSGQFSLKLTSSEDTVLEIGMAQDLGFCKSIKKDGQQCGAWIDARKTEYCDFHVNMQVERTRSGRMEINTMAGFDLFKRPGGGRGDRGGGARSRGGGRGNGSRNGKRDVEAPSKRTNGHYYDRSAHSSAYSLPPEFQRAGGGAANMLDAEDYAHTGGATPAERRKKRLVAQAKERDLARKLGAQGRGLGKEYMQSKRVEGDEDAGKDSGSKVVTEEAKDAQALGLVGRLDANLGPSSGVVSRSRSQTSGGLGWSSAFKRGLLSPTRGSSPKKARLKIDGKVGVRVPGRVSLPGPDMDAALDDELDIV